jgi:5'-3' exonuclease
MVEYEADDAIGAAAELFGADPRVERVVICTPDKDMAQCVRDERIVLWDRRRDIVYDDAGVRAKWGVAPESVPDRLALVGDAADGYPGLPGWGDKSASAVLARYLHFEAIPANGSEWDVKGLRNPVGLATTLRDHLDDALLYRDLARLRTIADGVPIPQRDVDELEWPGADRARWQAFCDEWGLARLRSRPHRWR